jgi:hypothetical protein
MKQEQKKGLEIDRLSEKILKSPLLLRKVCDRVYKLKQENLRNQRDRAMNSNGRVFF